MYDNIDVRIQCNVKQEYTFYVYKSKLIAILTVKAHKQPQKKNNKNL